MASAPSEPSPVVPSALRRAASVLPWNSLLAIAGQVFASGTNFGTVLIVARACGKEQLGLYYIGFTAVVFLIEAQNALISTPYTIYAPRLQGDSHARYLGSTLLHQLAFSAVVLALGLAAVLACSLGLGADGLAPVAASVVLVVTLVLFRDFMRRVLFANLRMVTALVCDVFVAVVQLGGLVLLAYLGLLTASTAYWVMGFAAGAVSLTWLLKNRRLFAPRVKDAVHDLKTNWSFGKWLFASGVLWGLSMNFYPWIIAAFHGAGATGVWTACFATVAVGNILMMGMQNFLGPKIATVYARKGVAATRRYVFEAGAAFAAPLILLCLVLWVAGDPIVTFLQGGEFAGNGLVIKVLGVNLLALALASVFSRGLFVLERADVDFAVNFVVLFVLLALGLWLVWAYGVLGAACGLLTANLAALVARCAAFLWCTHSRLEADKGCIP